MQCAKLKPTQPETLDIFVIELHGEFDFSERERLTDAFAVAKTAPLVFVNLEHTSYLDSTALECLLRLHTATRGRGANLILLGVHGSVRRIFEICQMDRVFDIRSTMCDIGMGSVTVRRLSLESRPI